MLHFESDYLEGAHPALLSRLLETNLEQAPGYGADPWCESAREKIRAACGCPGAAVHFLVGGTQTNAVVIDALLARHEGVLAAVTGHINGHEAGAVEACGHKVLPLPQKEGKLSAAEVRRYLAQFYADVNALYFAGRTELIEWDDALMDAWSGYGYFIPAYLQTIRADGAVDYTHMSWRHAG